MAETRGKRWYAAIALLSFSLAVLSRTMVRSIMPYWDWVQSLPDPARWLEQPVRWTLICLGGLWVAHRLRLNEMPDALGMTRSLKVGLAVAFVSTSPMLVVPLLLLRFDFAVVAPSVSWVQGILFGALIWPLGEEILFRGYAFRQLYRFGGLGLWPSAILIGAIFGVLHLGEASVQALPLAGEIGAVAIVSIGGILFAWLFARWDDNLWVPWGAHAFMNLWWEVFTMADSPLGGWLPNVLRAMSVILLIVFTLKREAIVARLMPDSARTT